MPTLIVLRHAKADSPLGTPDFERPLTSRGRRDARAAGDELRAAGRVPDHVICSPAVRTRQTLEELRIDAPVEFDDRVYDNDPEAILDLLRARPDEPATLLLVGHNPSMHRLVLDLGGAAGEGFPTSATAVIDFDGDWSDLWPGAGRLTAYWTPRTR
ncbi:histidine phosphatase family protein [Actinoallomurus sp. NPDC052274]|uniref:SixA phosphatase family protein n=1 Tax=Actinoallomurus sp. NPDC052274 TaxID=3155420 RepID=UPI00342E9133